MKRSLNHLKRVAIFTTIVDNGSFTAAATKLSMHRSKVSEQVAQLEQDLGVRLLQRSTRKLVLTVDGERLYQKTKDLLPQAHVALESLRSANADFQGSLKITTTHSLAQWVLGPFLCEFTRVYPELKINLEISDNTVDLLDGGYDLALRGGSPKDSSYVGQQLCTLPMYLAAHSSYLSRYGAPNNLEELSEHNGISISQIGLINQLKLTDLQGKFYSISLRNKHQTQSPLGASMMIEQGLGIGLLPAYIINESKGKLLPVLPEYHLVFLTISLLYPSRHALPARTRAFIDEFKQYLSSNPIVSSLEVE